MKAMVAHTKSHPRLGIQIENNRISELVPLILQHDRRNRGKMSGGGQQKTDPACFYLYNGNRLVSLVKECVCGLNREI